MIDEKCRFFVPGPSWVRPEILQEMARPLIGHRSSEFRELFGAILSDLKELFGTRHHAFVATCSGTGMLEGALINCVPRRVLVTTCGAFSTRWLQIAEQLGVEVDHLDHKWGKAVDPERLATHIGSRRGHYDAVTITHNETSTGVTNDVKELADIVHDASPGTLVLVDAVSSLGSAPLFVDEWGIDVCIASSQKGLALPPGLTLFSVSENAMARAAQTHYRGFYFDFLQYRKQAETNGAAFTPAISIIYALRKQLDYILRQETLPARWARHEAMQKRVWERTAAFAKPMTAADNASRSVTALKPHRLSGPDVVARMKERGFTLGGGYGEWREETFRIGHMGDLSLDDLDSMLDVFAEVAG